MTLAKDEHTTSIAGAAFALTSGWARDNACNGGKHDQGTRIELQRLVQRARAVLVGKILPATGFAQQSAKVAKGLMSLIVERRQHPACFR
jgi:hypothetical protein